MRVYLKYNPRMEEVQGRHDRYFAWKYGKHGRRAAKTAEDETHGLEVPALGVDGL